MDLLFRLIVLCLFIFMVRSLEDTTIFKPFGQSMCEDLCKSIEHCMSTFYDEKNLVCYPLIRSTAPANKNQQYTRTIKSRLKGLVTVAVKSTHGQVTNNLLVSSTQDDDEVQRTTEGVTHKQDQTTAPSTVSSAAALLPVVVVGYLVVTTEKATRIKHFYHLSTPGQHITKLKGKKGDIPIINFAFDNGKLLWIDKKRCLVVGKISLTTITPEICISYQGPRNIYQLEVDMNNQILFVKDTFTCVLHTAIINKQELIKWKRVGTIAWFLIDRIRRHIYKTGGNMLTRMGYNGYILKTFTLNHGKGSFFLYFQAEMIVYYTCSYNKIVKYEITGNAVKHDEQDIEIMRCSKLWKYGQDVFVSDVYGRLFAVKNNTLGQLLGGLGIIIDVYSL